MGVNGLAWADRREGREVGGGMRLTGVLTAVEFAVVAAMQVDAEVDADDISAVIAAVGDKTE